MSSKSLEVEEVPLAYWRCQSLTEEDSWVHTDREIHCKVTRKKCSKCRAEA